MLPTPYHICPFSLVKNVYIHHFRNIPTSFKSAHVRKELQLTPSPFLSSCSKYFHEKLLQYQRHILLPSSPYSNTSTSSYLIIIIILWYSLCLFTFFLSELDYNVESALGILAPHSPASLRTSASYSAIGSASTEELSNAARVRRNSLCLNKDGRFDRIK